MGMRYFKRFRMRIDLAGIRETPRLRAGFHFVPWHPEVLPAHAEVKYHCFSAEMDSTIFPCLGEREGCLRLMHEISERAGFLPEATWLVGSEQGYVGTVQGVVDRHEVGMIQNLGIVPEVRGSGLGTALLIRSLQGFSEAGLRWGMLEVTAENTGAVRLYRRLGFERARTVYKAVDAC